MVSTWLPDTTVDKHTEHIKNKTKQTTNGRGAVQNGERLPPNMCLQRALNINQKCSCCSCCGYLWSCMSTVQTDRQTDSQVYFGIPTHCQSTAQWDLLAWSVSDMFKLLHSGRQSRGRGVGAGFNHQFCWLYKCSQYSFV